MTHAHKNTTAVCSLAPVTALANEHTKVCTPQAHPAWSSITEKSTCLHLFLILSQPADIFLLLLVPLFEDSPLTLVQCNVLPWNTREASGVSARLGYKPYNEVQGMRTQEIQPWSRDLAQLGSNRRHGELGSLRAPAPKAVWRPPAPHINKALSKL